MRLQGMAAGVKWVLCVEARLATLTFGMVVPKKNKPPHTPVAAVLHPWPGRRSDTFCQPQPLAQ
jgi:hypothetical protein